MEENILNCIISFKGKYTFNFDINPNKDIGMQLIDNLKDAASELVGVPESE